MNETNETDHVTKVEQKEEEDFSQLLTHSQSMTDTSERSLSQNSILSWTGSNSDGNGATFEMDNARNRNSNRSMIPNNGNRKRTLAQSFPMDGQQTLKQRVDNLMKQLEEKDAIIRSQDIIIEEQTKKISKLKAYNRALGDEKLKGFAGYANTQLHYGDYGKDGDGKGQNIDLTPPDMAPISMDVQGKVNCDVPPARKRRKMNDNDSLNVSFFEHFPNADLYNKS